MLEMLNVVWTRERERERWCWKSRNEESWLARSCTLDNYSTKPLSPATHHFNFQLLTVFNSFSRNEKTLTRMFENSHAQSRHWPWRWWLGKTLFCSLARWGWELCLNSHKKRCNYLRPSDDLSALGARPRAASWLDTRSGKILKKCEWWGRALVTRERESPRVRPRPREKKTDWKREDDDDNPAWQGERKILLDCETGPRSRHGTRHPGLDPGRHGAL